MDFSYRLLFPVFHPPLFISVFVVVVSFLRSTYCHKLPPILTASLLDDFLCTLLVVCSGSRKNGRRHRIHHLWDYEAPWIFKFQFPDLDISFYTWRLLIGSILREAPVEIIWWFAEFFFGINRITSNFPDLKTQTGGFPSQKPCVTILGPKYPPWN